MAESFEGGRPRSSGRLPVRYSDLTSTDLDTFHSSASTVLGHHAFAGNQPDDFAISGNSGQSPRVLMLGLGLGGSIRSILAANPAARITALDFSTETTALCAALHANYFPNVHFETIVANAREFAEHVEGAFDAICVDLYDDLGYPEFVLLAEFWADVASFIAPVSGFVMANAWGLPTHLGWSENSEAQFAVAGAMQSALGPIRALPHRRNVTVFSGDVAFPMSRRVAPIESLHSRIDMLQIRLLRLRAVLARQVEGLEQPRVVSETARTKVHLNTLMNELWHPALQRLFSAAAVGGITPASVFELVANPSSVAAAVHRARGDLQLFLPNVASNWIHQYGGLPLWYRDATEATYEDQIQRDLGMFVLGWLTQYVALLIKCPIGLEYTQDLAGWTDLADEVLTAVEGKVIA
ncbi:hypothetical protein [Leifsonia poae]|uniref:hypothetical protein n=1 Tax=Leifsonia poae TaxID=110933 RepID=UPI003D6750BB